MAKKNNLIKKMESGEARLAEYEELLVRRDQLYKEAGSYMTAYAAEFGDLIIANFELKVECIKKKKIISYCRRRINRGLSIDTDRMQTEIDREMTLYNKRLQDLIDNTESAKKAKNVGGFRFERAKKIYRRLAKLIHPDINKKTSEDETLKELWERVVEAYHLSDVDELDDLEVMVHRTLETMGEEGYEVEFSDIEERIDRVERQINDILTTEPYTYGEILKDPEKKTARKEELQAEHEDYEQYMESLTKTLNETLREGGATLVWKLE